MKLYKFFKKPNKDLSKIPNAEFSIQQKYPLYAITQDKDLAKAFIKTRNMDLFLYKVDDVSKESIDDIVNAKRNRMIQEYEFNTKVHRHTSEEKDLYIKVVMTESEIDLVMEYGDSGEIMNIIQDWIPIEIFEDDVYDALQQLLYIKCMQFATGTDGYETTVIDRLDFPVRFDLFSIFLYTYGDTLSPEFFEYSKMTDHPVTESPIHN